MKTFYEKTEDWIKRIQECGVNDKETKSFENTEMELRDVAEQMLYEANAMKQIIENT